MAVETLAEESPVQALVLNCATAGTAMANVRRQIEKKERTHCEGVRDVMALGEVQKISRGAFKGTQENFGIL